MTDQIPDPPPDPIDVIVAKILKDGQVTLDSFSQGRQFGAFCAGAQSGAQDMGFPMSISAAVALTETYMTGDPGWLEDDDDEDDEEEDEDDD